MLTGGRKLMAPRGRSSLVLLLVRALLAALLLLVASAVGDSGHFENADARNSNGYLWGGREGRSYLESERNKNSFRNPNESTKQDDKPGSDSLPPSGGGGLFLGSTATPEPGEELISSVDHDPGIDSYDSYDDEDDYYYDEYSDEVYDGGDYSIGVGEEEGRSETSDGIADNSFGSGDVRLTASTFSDHRWREQDDVSGGGNRPRPFDGDDGIILSDGRGMSRGRWDSHAHNRVDHTNDGGAADEGSLFVPSFSKLPPVRAVASPHGTLSLPCSPASSNGEKITILWIFEDLRQRHQPGLLLGQTVHVGVTRPVQGHVAPVEGVSSQDGRDEWIPLDEALHPPTTETRGESSHGSGWRDPITDYDQGGMSGSYGQVIWRRPINEEDTLWGTPNTVKKLQKGGEVLRGLSPLQPKKDKYVPQRGSGEEEGGVQGRREEGGGQLWSGASVGQEVTQPDIDLIEGHRRRRDGGTAGSLTEEPDTAIVGEDSVLPVVTGVLDGDGLVTRNKSRRRVLEDGSLYFGEVLPSDIGRYRCLLQGAEGAVVAPSTTLALAALSRWSWSPPSVTVVEGGGVRLSCHLESTPPAALFWIKGNLTLAMTSRHFEPSPGVLQISPATVDDQGEYRCLGHNSLLNKSSLSLPGYLTVRRNNFVEPKLNDSVETTNQDPSEEKSPKISPKKKASPPPRSRPAPLHEDDEDESVVDSSDFEGSAAPADSLLELRGEAEGLGDALGGVWHEDGGSRGSPSNGSDPSHPDLWFSAVDSILHHNLVGITSFPDTNLLKEEVGNTNPTNHPENSNTIDSNTSPSKPSFSTSSPVSPGSLGPGSSFSASGSSDPSDEVSFLPKLLPVPQSVEVREGGALVLECLSNAATTAGRIVWSKMVKGTMTPLVQGRRHRQEGQGTVIISPAAQSDAGLYNCTLFSALTPHPFTQMVSVSVFSVPTVSVLPPSQVVSKGLTAKMNCSSEGHPPPELSWFKDGAPINVGNVRYLLESSVSRRRSGRPAAAHLRLKIVYLQHNDSGLYQCLATNNAGQASSISRLKIALPSFTPPAPVNLRGQPLTPTSIKVTWDPLPGATDAAQVSGNGEALNPKYDQIWYIVFHMKEPPGGSDGYQQASDSGAPRPQEYEFVSPHPEVTLRSLDPSTAYSVYIRTVVTVASSQDPFISDPSRTISVGTLNQRPTGAPALTATPVAPNSVLLRWGVLSPSQLHGKHVTQHKLQYKLMPPTARHDGGGRLSAVGSADDAVVGPDGGVQTLVLSADVYTYNLTGLKSGGRYQMLLLTANELGYPISLHGLPWLEVTIPTLPKVPVPPPAPAYSSLQPPPQPTPTAPTLGDWGRVRPQSQSWQAPRPWVPFLELTVKASLSSLIQVAFSSPPRDHIGGLKHRLLSWHCWLPSGGLVAPFVPDTASPDVSNVATGTDSSAGTPEAHTGGDTLPDVPGVIDAMIGSYKGLPADGRLDNAILISPRQEYFLIGNVEGRCCNISLQYPPPTTNISLSRHICTVPPPSLPGIAIRHNQHLAQNSGSERHHRVGGSNEELNGRSPSTTAEPGDESIVAGKARGFAAKLPIGSAGRAQSRVMEANTGDTGKRSSSSRTKGLFNETVTSDQEDLYSVDGLHVVAHSSSRLLLSWTPAPHPHLFYVISASPVESVNSLNSPQILAHIRNIDGTLMYDDSQAVDLNEFEQKERMILKKNLSWKKKRRKKKPWLEAPVESNKILERMRRRAEKRSPIFPPFRTIGEENQKVIHQPEREQVGEKIRLTRKERFRKYAGQSFLGSDELFRKIRRGAKYTRKPLGRLCLRGSGKTCSSFDSNDSLNYSTHISRQSNFAPNTLEYRHLDQKSIYRGRGRIDDRSSDHFRPSPTNQETVKSDQMSFDRINSLDREGSNGTSTGRKKRAADSHWSVIATAHSVEVGGLVPHTAYAVKVQTCSVGRCGAPSLPLWGFTIDGGATSPRDVSWQPVSASQVSVSWRPPLFSLAPPPTHYRLSFSSDGRRWRETAVLFNTTHIVLDFLVSNTNYSLYIAAARKRDEAPGPVPESVKHANGSSQWSPLLSSPSPDVMSDSADNGGRHTMNDDPLAPRALRSRVNAPSLDSGEEGGPILGLFSNSDDPFWAVEEEMMMFEEEEDYSEEDEGGVEGTGKERASAMARLEAEQWESVGEWTSSVFIVHAVIVSEAEKWTSSAYSVIVAVVSAAVALTTVTVIVLCCQMIAMKRNTATAATPALPSIV